GLNSPFKKTYYFKKEALKTPRKSVKPIFKEITAQRTLCGKKEVIITMISNSAPRYTIEDKLIYKTFGSFEL
ncbi:unnamed protein product, partial [marine sediment metagenome]